MTQPVFINPVVGPIHDKAWPRPAASHEFKITATLADHIASGRAGGIDIGNGHCNDPVFAMASGKVSMAGLLGLAKTVRIVHPQYPGYETGATHLSTIMVKVGDMVQQGDQIGTHGMTGADACHLHQGCKYNGVEVDWLPFLIQNGAGNMNPIPAGSYTLIVNKKTTVISTIPARFRADRYTAAEVIKAFPAGTWFYPVSGANDGTNAGGATPTTWYGGFLYSDHAPVGVRFGWFHSSLLGPLVDVVVPGGSSAADKATIADLTAKLSVAQVQAATAVADAKSATQQATVATGRITEIKAAKAAESKAEVNLAAAETALDATIAK